MFLRAAAFRADAFAARFLGGEVGGVAPEPEVQPGSTTHGGGDHDYEMRVRAWWDRIEVLRAEKQTAEARETQREAALKAARDAAGMAEQAAKRKGIRRAERQRAQAEVAEAKRTVTALENELGDVAAQIAEIESAMAELTALIDAERVLREQRLAFLAGRRRMMLALVLASQ